MRVLIAGAFRFPYGDAASNRVFEMARALQVGNVDVSVLTIEGREKIDINQARGVREGVPYFIQKSSVSSKGGALRGVLRFLSLRATVVLGLESLGFKPDVVILYGASAWVASGVVKWAKSNRVKIVGDIVEWYDVGQCAGGYFGPYYYDSQVFMRSYYKKLDGIIAISGYLKSYFHARGVPVLQVPGLATPKTAEGASSLVKAERGRFEVIYSGFPGKKDLFLPILQAARILASKGSDIIFSFTGRGLEQAIRLAGFSEKEIGEMGNVVVHGWCSEERLREIRSSASVAVVLRTPGRSSAANFPQKLAEYMSEGKAVIVNDVGDMAKCVSQSGGGIVLSAATGEELAHVLLELSLNSDAVLRMGALAKSYAIKNFDPISIAMPLCEFVSNV